ncbi:MAG: hypothetical protein OMM_00479 [Candidatus Magnetoglobus multicellularis str. Araruama]|uniref:Peptidase MA-like domain-containing protein n=1 Tax=Candidatus Magnetoglobus multicellularis str. Araruama TaxID=890399 RepID=A0A1V1PH56_9BACT|nr:MAG: hypothetical protein OMM_00479 [Candidatus Magnetoglobus multicellularis str. Araruama]
MFFPQINRHVFFKQPLIIVIMLLMCSLPEGYANPDYNELETWDVTIVYPDFLQSEIPDILSTYQWTKKNVQNIFQWPILAKIRLIVINNRKDFLQVAEHPLTLAFATPSRNQITIDYQSVITQPYSLETTLQHELCHILLGQHLKMPVPRWLNEGIAQWASEGISEIIRPRGSVLHKAIISNTLIPFYRLDYSFPMESDAFVLAYEQSHSFVVYLVQQYGKESLLQILNQMKRGESLHSAIRFEYGVSLLQLERDWRATHAQFFTWLLFLSIIFIHLYLSGLHVFVSLVLFD